jgi:putative transposase
VRYEYPQGRRVNALAAYRPYDRAPRLEVATAERTWVAEDLVAFVKALPRAKVPRVVVLDNAGLHTKAARLARRDLIALGIYLYFLPAYSPELNEIEPVFRQVKYQEMPVRSYTSRAGLREAVVEGFASYRGKLRPKRERKPRPTA